YHTAWLKAHYPAEFLAAVMSCEMAHPDAVVAMRAEAGRMGLSVLPPDINHSRLRFTVPGENQIRYGLGAVKGVGQGAVENIVAERDRNGPFRDLFDFCQRIDARKVNKRVLEALVMCGALDQLGANRASMLATLPKALQLAEATAQGADSGQVDLFGLGGGSRNEQPAVEAEQLPEWSLREKLAHERETLGFYQSGHPLDAYRELVDAICSGRMVDLVRAVVAAAPAPVGPDGKQQWQPRTKQLFAAWVKDVRFFKGDAAAEGRNARASYKVTVEDSGVELSCWIDADAFARYQPFVKTDGLVFLIAEIGLSLARDGRDPEARLYAPEFFSLDQVLREYAQRLNLEW
ncbi:MAG: DNA polymerase III subunit alpha, partial [Hydrocarboniphaga effusa]|nr:DNA polymerase III subunit alpha [Hydrocarboniphaga effusa]